MSQNNGAFREETVERWADIVIEKWLRKIEQMGIGGDNLVRSFTQNVMWAANGDMSKVEFMFDYVGKFIDMGVGRGVSLGIRDAKIAAGLTTRRPKPWFTDTFYKQVAVLRHIIAERTAENTALAIVHQVMDSNEKV